MAYAKRQNYIIQLIGWVLLITALFGVGVHGYLGTFSRYIADDFCTAGDVTRLGFWGAQAKIYSTWSGRFMFTFSIAVTHLIGPTLTPALPAIALMLWLVALSFFFHRVLLVVAKLESLLPATLLAVIIVNIVLAAAPNLYQSLYWQTGMLTYSFPLILSTAYLGWLITLRRTSGAPSTGISQSILAFFWPFIMGGFSETFVTVQTVGLIILIGFVNVYRSNSQSGHIKRILILGLIGSILAMVIVAAAPGNASRQGFLPNPPGIFRLLERTLSDWYIFSVRTLKWNPLAILLSGIIPTLTGFWVAHRKVVSISSEKGSRLDPLIWLVGIPFLTFLLMCASIAPYEYAISSFPDARVLITTLYICVLGISAWGFILGACLARWFQNYSSYVVLSAGLLSVLIVPLFGIHSCQTFQNVTKDFDKMRTYAISWDTRDANLRSEAEAGNEIVLGASLAHMGGGLAEIGYDPEEWINVCVARAYGIDQIIAK